MKNAPVYLETIAKGIKSQLLVSEEMSLPVIYVNDTMET